MAAPARPSHSTQKAQKALLRQYQTASDVGGETAAVLYTFTQTCQALGIEPWRYLRGVLERLPRHPPERLGELLPDEWARAQRGATEPAAPAEPSTMPPPPSG
jgi:hypothetical protein